MPEGDTIFRAARTLHRALADRVVSRFESVFPALTRVHHDAPLTGRTIDRVEAVGKHVLMHFSGGLVLRTHMRMNGSWHIYRPGERWRRPRRDMRIVVATDAFEAVGFNVPVAEFIRTSALRKHDELRRLGPDLLSDGFDRGEALRRLRARPTAVVADARTGAVVRRMQIPEGTGGLRYGFGSLWAALGPDQLVRLDPATGDVRQQYDVGLSPVFVSVGTDRVWVMNQASGSVSAVDPRSGEVTEVVVDTGVIEGGDIVATPEAVWVRVTDVLAARVDPNTMAVTDRIGAPSGSGGVGVNGSDLWISAHDVHVLWRFPGGA